MRYKITIEYDGSYFSGWQKNVNSSSVQECLEVAIYAFTKQNVIVYGSGRTDSGVHALGQVAHFDLILDWPEHKVINAINYYLPKTISVIFVEKVNNDFHARFSAIKRHYLYKIVNRPSRVCLQKGRVWHFIKKLDLKLMRKCADILTGYHDFTSFRNPKCQSTTPFKTIDEIKIDLNDTEINVFISAQSFLYNQVRIMVGTIAEIASGRDLDLVDIFDACDRKKSGLTAPACGLYLLKVEY